MTSPNNPSTVTDSHQTAPRHSRKLRIGAVCAGAAALVGIVAGCSQSGDNTINNVPPANPVETGAPVDPSQTVGTTPPAQTATTQPEQQQPAVEAPTVESITAALTAKGWVVGNIPGVTGQQSDGSILMKGGCATTGTAIVVLYGALDAPGQGLSYGTYDANDPASALSAADTPIAKLDDLPACG